MVEARRDFSPGVPDEPNFGSGWTSRWKTGGRRNVSLLNHRNENIMERPEHVLPFVRNPFAKDVLPIAAPNIVP
jgi:hypothetical protein